MKERILYFDLLKGTAIFLVVMGHALTMCIRDIDAAPLFKIVSQVHMPIFFFVSGFLAYKDGFAMPKLGKKVSQLLVPTIVVGTIWFFVFPSTKIESPLYTTVEGMLLDPWKNGYWFTLCLFELFLVYSAIAWVLRRIASGLLKLIVVCVGYFALFLLSKCSILTGGDPLSLTLTTQFYPVFFMGVFAHRHIDTYNNITTGDKAYYPIAWLVLIPLYYLASYPWEFEFLPKDYQYITTPIMNAALIVVAVVLAKGWSGNELANGVKPTAITRYFNYLGQKSLGIYLLHYFFLFPLAPLREPLRNLGLSILPTLVVAVIVAFFVVACALFAVYCVERNKFLARILIGKV